MVDVVQHDCIQQAPQIRPLCFEKHQLFFFFFKPACSAAMHCNVLTPPSATLNLLAQLLSNILMESRGRNHFEFIFN